jgi:ppGpp synthetase/RelA/SpoT-type nucleotidyltranferase
MRPYSAEEQERFAQRFKREEVMYGAWGEFVRDTVLARLGVMLPPPANLDTYLKIPPQHRVKSMHSLLGKAFARGFEFNDPYSEILDKVGVRFVVLLTEQVRKIGNIIREHEGWQCEVSRDFEKDRELNPTVFDYQSLHLIVRSKEEVHTDKAKVTAGTPCEVQVRTLLQHAYSEMSHDTVYKPTIIGTSGIHRLLAKSMALIETADGILEEANSVITNVHDSATAAVEGLSVLYRDVVQEPPLDDFKSNVFLLNALQPALQVNVADIKQFVNQHQFIGELIRKHQREHPIFQLATVLLAYYLVSTRRYEVKKRWPLPDTELEPIFTDLGFVLRREV